MSQSSTEYVGQQERILELLKSRGYGQWVQLWEILDLQPRIVDIGTRLFELRHKRDLNIQNKKWRVNGVTHSAYRLLPGSYRELGGKPESERAGGTRQSRAEWFEREFGKRAAVVPEPSTIEIELPLFGVRR
jgi:hypothetical protein